MRNAWLVAAVALMLAACGRGETLPSTATPSPVVTPPPLLAGTLTALAASPTPRSSPLPSATPDLRPPFTIASPADQSALPDPGDTSSTWYRVLDLATGRVQVLHVDVDRLPMASGGSKPLDFAWFDDETLAITTAAGTYRTRLAGGALPALGPALTPTPQSTPGAPAASADGAWSVADQPGVSGNMLVGPAGAVPRFRLVNAYSPQWAPVGHLLAFHGNVCGGEDVFAFEPDTGALRNLTATLDEGAYDFIWKPDASAIAVFSSGIVDGVDRRSIELIDVQSSERRTPVEMRIPGETIPLAWSPGGKRLLYVARTTGRGFCDEGGVPTPRPTRLERLP